MTDEWKGEHHIRAKPSKEDRHTRTLQLASRYGHWKRQQRGESMSQMGGPWAKTNHVWMMEAKAQGNT